MCEVHCDAVGPPSAALESCTSLVTVSVGASEPPSVTWGIGVDSSWSRRAAELKAENDHLRGLIQDAGHRAERAFRLLAETDIQHQRELEVAQTEAASARSLLRQAYQETGEHRRLVVGELHHRARNMLTVVQAIALQTLRNAGSLEEARTALGNRIAALAQANDLLVGEGTEAGIGAIVADAVGLLDDGRPDRFAVSGPDIPLEPRATLALGMALHELGTNAAKHGALSAEHGRVEIAWRAGPDGRGFSLRWTERGGPPVSPPTRRGFGSQLLDRLGGELQGRIALAYEPAGVVCTITGT